MLVSRLLASTERYKNTPPGGSMRDEDFFNKFGESFREKGQFFVGLGSLEILRLSINV